MREIPARLGSPALILLNMDILLLCNVPMTSHTLYLTNQILKFCNLSYNDVTKIPEKHRFYFPDAGTLARFEGFVWTKERSWLWSSTCINYQPKYLRTFSISVSCFSKGRKTLWNNTVDRQTGVKDLRSLNLTPSQGVPSPNSTGLHYANIRKVDLGKPTFPISTYFRLTLLF